MLVQLCQQVRDIATEFLFPLACSPVIDVICVRSQIKRYESPILCYKYSSTAQNMPNTEFVEYIRILAR